MEVWTHDSMTKFRATTILADQIPNIECRLSCLTTTRRSGRETTYLVFAHPNEAKVKHGRRGVLISVWPEACIGIISTQSRVRGKDKTWSMRPTLRSGNGWRKKPIAAVKGREEAAMGLLEFWAEENGKREDRNADHR